MERFWTILAVIGALITQHQTLIVGLFAVFIAYRQMGIASIQAEIQREQFRVATEQAAQDKALATIEIDRAHVAIARIEGSMLASGAYTNIGNAADGSPELDWGPVALVLGKDIPNLDVEALGKLAVKAFPESAPDFVQLFHAASDVRALAIKHGDAVKQGTIWPPAEGTPPGVNDAIKRLIKYVGVCAKLAPHIRTGKAG